MIQGLLVGKEALSGNSKSQNHFHNNTKIPFALFILTLTASVTGACMVLCFDIFSVLIFHTINRGDIAQISKSSFEYHQ